MKQPVICFKVGRGRTEVELLALRLGRDWCVHINGGDIHIGAVALATTGCAAKHSKASVTVVPGHKEGDWAFKIAEQLTKQIRRTVCVTMGIHVDNITKKEIQTLEKHTKTLAKKFISHIKKGNYH